MAAVNDRPQPHVDEYPSLSHSSPHFAPRLVLEQPVLPALTLSVAEDGRTGLVQRWYDVPPATLDGIGIRSRDFFPDGVLKLLDKDGQEIRKAPVKLDVEWDGLPLLLARIEKVWAFSDSFQDFWQKVQQLMFQTPVPSYREVVPGAFIVARGVWIEFCCFWVAFLGVARRASDGAGWTDLPTGDQLVIEYVEYYNSRPERGPHFNCASFNIERVKLGALLEKVRLAPSNDQKKKTLETLAEFLLGGIEGFAVRPSTRSATGELDRFVRNNSPNPQFVALGEMLIVECKHWGRAVGTDEIGAFIADLQDARQKSGILLSRKGISREAQNRIFNYFQREKGFIIPLLEGDIEKVCNGLNLDLMMIEKMEAITFQKPLQTSLRAARKKNKQGDTGEDKRT
jgi:hypothetical protein